LKLFLNSKPQKSKKNTKQAIQNVEYENWSSEEDWEEYTKIIQ
jgi:hypothetical protein